MYVRTHHISSSIFLNGQLRKVSDDKKNYNRTQNSIEISEKWRKKTNLKKSKKKYCSKKYLKCLFDDDDVDFKDKMKQKIDTK